VHVDTSAAKPSTRALLALLVLSGVALWLHPRIPSFTDPDSLYHIRHAWIYRTQGLWQSDFPWAQFSAIHRESSDLWYGFHVLLIPFTLTPDLLDGIRVAGFLVTLGCLMLVWGALARLEVRWPLVWTLVFAFATADSLYRLTMMRPHPLSLGIALLLFALLCEERSPRWGILALAAGLAWIHITLAWIPVLVWIVISLARRARKRSVPWLPGAFLGFGLFAGALLRPHPLGGIRLASIQILTWLAKRGASVPLEVGRELKPFEWRHFTDQLVPATALAAAAAVLLLVSKARGEKEVRRGVAAWSSLALCALFFAMCFTVARRANDLCVGFATILAACAASPRIDEVLQRQWSARSALLAPLFLAAAIAPIRSVERYRTYLQAAEIVGPERMREPALWLREHAAPGDVVFNVHWDTFAHLFYWNPASYYVSGHDPIFLYAYDPGLYWICQELETDGLIVREGRGFVSDAPVQDRGDLLPLHDALVRRFRARWLVVQKARAPRLSGYLRTDPGFELGFETQGEVVFRILP
jgi:hypothetical protein